MNIRVNVASWLTAFLTVLLGCLLVDSNAVLRIASIGMEAISFAKKFPVGFFMAGSF
jgi:hypothetical protein